MLQVSRYKWLKLMRCILISVQKKLLPDLDCCWSIWKEIPQFRCWRQGQPNGKRTLGKNRTAWNELYCKRLLEALRKCNSRGKAYTVKSRNFHSGRNGSLYKIENWNMKQGIISVEIAASVRNVPSGTKCVWWLLRTVRYTPFGHNPNSTDVFSLTG